MATYRTFLLTLCSLFSCLTAWERTTFRSLFEKVPNMHLRNTNSRQPFDDVDLEQCAKFCTKETRFDCKSFDYIVSQRRCILHALGDGDPAESLQYDPGFDHISRGNGLLTSLPNSRLLSVGLGYKNWTYHNTTREMCTTLCVNQRSFMCLSFDIAKDGSICVLHSGTVRNPTERLIKWKGTDHYKTAYYRLFRELPFHSISVPYNHKHEYIASLEECARRCILEIKFKCRSIFYEELSGNCQLSEHNSHTEVGGRNLHTHAQDANYYERIPDGPLSSFVNFGLGNIMSHSPGNTFQVMSPDECAQKCLDLEVTECASFDFQTQSKFCFLSRFTAGSAHGLALTQRDQTIHYERISENLSYFYTTPYAIIAGNNRRTDHGITPDECARRCIEELDFVCRSFDYRVMDSTCLLSTKTGSDVGGLFKQQAVQLHHFEMKPILDCGGVFTEASGDFASLNWPRDYESNINCTWTIRAPRNKVIKLVFAHFDLVSESSCSENGDHLEVTEYSSGELQVSSPYCLQSGTKNWISDYNNIDVSFVTDSHLSAQGFRAFYTIDWPCKSAIFIQKNGDFASPNWPGNYPSKTHCNYLIVAPAGHIVRINFTHFEMNSEFVSGKCSMYTDHVDARDGMNRYSPLIGRYCDEYPSPLVIESTTNYMFIEFFSADEQAGKTGFHGKYEVLNSTMAFKSIKGSALSALPVGVSTNRKGKWKDKRFKKGGNRPENYTPQSATGVPDATKTYSVGNSTGSDDDHNSILNYIIKKQTALAAAIVLAVIVLAGLLTAGVVVVKRTRKSMRQNERGYLLHDNLSVSGRVSSIDLTAGHTMTEPHYESVDEHTLFINTTGALQNPTYDRSSPELPPRPQPDVVT